MATRPKVVPHTVTSAGELIRIWGATSLLDDYISGLDPDAAGAVTERTESVNASQVNRYPGDTGFSRGGHSRTKSNEIGKGGITLPGKPFYCERTEGVGPAAQVKVRQFGYEGSWNNLKKYVRTNKAGAAFTLRNASGRSIEVDAGA